MPITLPRFPAACLALAVLLAAAPAATLANPTPGPKDEVAHALGRPSTKSALDEYVQGSKERTLEAAKAKGISLPADFLAWIDSDRLRRETVYGCRKDPLPVLLGLRSLEIDLGPELVRRDYPQLALAFAIQGSYDGPKKKASGWNDGDKGDAASAWLPDVGPRPRLVLQVPGDPRVPVDTKDAARTLDRDDHIINFLEDHEEIEVEVPSQELPPLEYDEKGVAKPQGKPVTVMKKARRKPLGADVIASPELQAEFNAYLAAHGHPEVAIDCGDHLVSWYSTAAIGEKERREKIAAAHELFHAAYKAKGRMPAERDAPPTAAESMAWFVRNDRHPFSAAQRAERHWPMFPLDAPWPVLLMLAADDQPLREREEIWAKFRDQGEFKTYGEYIGDIAQQFDMQSARRVSPFAFSYGSIEMMWKDGGVCGTMGNIGARTYRICGVPASTAGQPGHCAMVFMEHDPKTGEYRCKGGQYATGGDEVTSVHANWNYDDAGPRKPMVFHQAVAWAVTRDFPGFVDSLVLRQAWEGLDSATKAKRCVDLVEEAMELSPFALPAIEAAIGAADQPAKAIAALDAFNERFARVAKPEEYGLYRSTVRDLAHARVLALPAPTERADLERLLTDLERQECADAKLLARTWQALDGKEGFTKRCVEAAERYLASPERARNKKTSQAFAAKVKAWEKSVKGRENKAAWAKAMLEVFRGKETLTIKGKESRDPTVEILEKAAGDPPPATG